MRPADFDIQKVINSLQGTCQTLDEALPEGMEWEDLTSEDHSEIDNQLFLCGKCGWWCEESENHESEEYDEGVCDDCHEED